MATEQISERDARSLEYVSDTYAVRSILGQGASATVYLADDLEAGRPVVLKLLGQGAGSGSDAVISRFRDEVAATRRLQHENIVRILDYGVTDDRRPFLVTEFTAGRSLAAVLREAGRLTTTRAVEAGIAIAEALVYVHSRGFVHRDLKPSNVLIPGWPDAPDFSRSKLLDFGVAGRLEQSGHTQAGMIYGTLRYMSPEQVKGEQQSAATDVYGFGLLLFEMLAGSAPAKREQDLTTLLIAIRDGISDEDLRSIEPYLADLIRRCVRSNPAERPTMTAVLEELKPLSRPIRIVSADAALEMDLDQPAASAAGLPPAAPLPPAPAAQELAERIPDLENSLPSAQRIAAAGANPAVPPAPATPAQKLMESTLVLPKDRPAAPLPRASATGARRWLLWTALAAITAAFAIAAIVYFRPGAPAPHPRPIDSKAAPEKPSGPATAFPNNPSTVPPTAQLPVPSPSNDTTVRAIRFGAGLLLMGASVGIAFGLRRWLGSRSQVKSQAMELVFGAQARTDLTATIALQLEDLISKLRGLDERILAGTVALMLEEYGTATDTKDRQAALMNVVALSEKLAVRLSPWYERYKEIIASAVALMGGVSGLMTAINSVLSHKH